MTNLIGQSLGRYHILEQLGEGGMATVYKAYDTRLETEVAVKVIRTDSILPRSLEHAVKRFDREAKALAKLTHANIVKVLDYGEHAGSPYLVMPYLPGGTLKESLKGKPMPWQDAARLLVPIARALDFAHRQGMVHRDVKPSNIIITADGDPMLTDFGIAKILDIQETVELTGTNAAIGTPEYMAPEQSTSNRVDLRADIYALGVVFYEMSVGRKPYIAETPMAVLIKHASEPLPRPRQFVPNLPQAVENVLLKALAKSPNDRYQGMGEFATALEHLAAGKTASEKPAGKENNLNQSAQYKYRSWIITGVSALIVISLLSTWMIKGGWIPINNPIGNLDHLPVVVSPAPTTIPMEKEIITPTPASLTNQATVVLPKLPTQTNQSTTVPPTLPDDLPPVTWVTSSSGFDNLPIDFEIYGNYDLLNGIISLQEPITSGDIWANGSSKLVLHDPVKPGNGYLILFRTKPGVIFLITMEYGPFDQAIYRAAWIGNGTHLSIWTGKNETLNRNLNFQYKNDTWYYFVMRRYTEGFEGFLWEKDLINKVKSFKAVTGDDWAENNLQFTINVPEGVFEIDEFQELEFSVDKSVPFIN